MAIYRSFRLILLLLVASALSAAAHNICRGKFSITDERLTLQGKDVRLQMHVSFDESVLRKGSSYVFTPFIEMDSQRQTFTPVAVSSKERSRYDSRKARLRGSVQPVVASIQSGATTGLVYFDYDFQIPYSVWMNAASLKIETEESGWTDQTIVFEEQIISHIALAGLSATRSPYVPASGLTAQPVSQSLTTVVSPSQPSTPALTAAPLEWIVFLSPTDNIVSEKKTSGVIQLDDSRHLAALRDRPFVETVAQEIRKQLGATESVVVSLSIHGFGAPIGNFRKNEQRSAIRAQLLKEYLVEQQVARTVTTTWTTEDWESIIRLSQADPTISLRSAALDIMQHVDIANGREDQLKMLGGGTTYTQLSKQLFPRVQRLEFTALLQHQTVNATDAIELQHFYQTALGLPKGTDEYNELIDLAARLHPDNAVAAINAAGIALTKGQLDKAERYLAPWDTDLRASQHLGVLCLLKGETDKARVYLKIAESQGSATASTVLAYMAAN